MLGIVLQLQAKGWQRAEDLAQTFEISKRTVYRDLEALGEMGVPVIAQPGQGYRLMEGYFLPPLSFTTDEAMALLLGTDFIAQIFDAQFSTAARAAAGKITAVLSEQHQQEIKRLKASLHLIALNVLDDGIKPEILRQLRRAIVAYKTIRFEYHARSGEEPGGTTTLRDADPYGLMHYNGHWYMAGYCHLRKAVRNFRLDRIHRLSVLPVPFVRLPDFDMRHGRDEGNRNLVVRALFDQDTAPWVHEDRLYYIHSKEDTPDGLLVTLRVRHETEIVQWLLGWGANVRILEPDSLRERLLREVEGMLMQFQKAESLLP